MSASWFGFAGLCAAALAVSVTQTLSTPTRATVKSTSPGFVSQASPNKALLDKAFVFASAAQRAGTFSGSVSWASMSVASGLPSAIRTAPGIPANWSATNDGTTATICMPGVSAMVLDAVHSNFTGVVAKSNGC